MIQAGGTARVLSVAERLQPHEGRLTPEQRALAALLLEGANA
jgi:hypothetical protein